MEANRREFLKIGAAAVAAGAVCGAHGAGALPASGGAAVSSGCAAKLRYACKGEVHRDFHASSLDGINYLLDNYGEASVRRVLTNTGTKVFRQMHEKLVKGDTSELIAWWRYYMDREGGTYEIRENQDGTAVLTVRECPALKHLKARKVPGGERTCWATDILNAAFCKDSPFEVVLERTGDCSCRQTLRRRTV